MFSWRLLASPSPRSSARTVGTLARLAASRCLLLSDIALAVLLYEDLSTRAARRETLRSSTENHKIYLYY